MYEAKLVKVEVFNDGNSWSMQWKGQSYVHRGDLDSFSKLLRKIKASDDHKDPKSYRDVTYKQMASEIANGSDRFIWVWEHMLKKLYEENEMRRIYKEEKDPKATKIIKDLAKSYGDSNEEQGKLVNLMKGLAFSDDPEANKFMVALDKWTTEYANKMDESLKEGVSRSEAMKTIYKELSDKFGHLLNRDSLDYIELQHMVRRIMSDYQIEVLGTPPMAVSKSLPGNTDYEDVLRFARIKIANANRPRHLGGMPAQGR